MTRVVRLPPNFRLNAIDRFTQDIVAANGRPLDRAYIFDFSRLNFIDGSGYTVLSNTLAWLKTQGCSSKFANVDANQSNAIKYLDDCGFFRTTIQRYLSGSSCVRSTTLPCAPIKAVRGFSWIENHLSPFLQHELEVSYGSLSSVRACVKELINNIGDHSDQDTGFIHAQHYPNLRSVKITVSDFGVGIPATIRARFGDMSDGEAIRMAAEEGVTSQSRPNNMGAGLNFLIDCVTSNEGSVLIHSLSGSLACSRERGKQIRRPSNGRGRYPGTLVDITLDTRLLEGDDDERGEVEWW